MFDDRTEAADPADLADAERVSDPEAVYDDLDALPDWWRELVLEFAEYDLRPYRPSRLADGAVTYEVIEDLEDRFDVRVDLRTDDPTRSDSWRVVVDGTTVLSTIHERKAEGFTRYSVTEEALVEAVTRVVSERS